MSNLPNSGFCAPKPLIRWHSGKEPHIPRHCQAIDSRAALPLPDALDSRLPWVGDCVGSTKSVRCGRGLCRRPSLTTYRVEGPPHHLGGFRGEVGIDAKKDGENI